MSITFFFELLSNDLFKKMKIKATEQAKTFESTQPTAGNYLENIKNSKFNSTKAVKLANEPKT